MSTIYSVREWPRLPTESGRWDHTPWNGMVRVCRAGSTSAGWKRSHSRSLWGCFATNGNSFSSGDPRVLRAGVHESRSFFLHFERAHLDSRVRVVLEFGIRLCDRNGLLQIPGANVIISPDDFFRLVKRGLAPCFALS